MMVVIYPSNDDDHHLYVWLGHGESARIGSSRGDNQMTPRHPERKIALVTGASSGIGEATADRLARAGYKVYGTSRRATPAGPRSFAMLPLDVTSDESVEAAVAQLIRLEGRIDVLVNNAGFGVAPGGAEE